MNNNQLIESMDDVEKAEMLKAWKAAKDCAENINASKNFIYWEDVEAVIDNLCSGYYCGDDCHNIHPLLTLQSLEEKSIRVNTEENRVAYLRKHIIDCLNELKKLDSYQVVSIETINGFEETHLGEANIYLNPKGIIVIDSE